jgi:D-glycero-alpha-D-manno-heptose 1-phosphate guanylyltransferase
MEAIILCGGLGTRIKPVLGNTIPKCMAPINNNKPFLSYLFDYLIGFGIERCILATGFLQDKIMQYYGSSYLDTGLRLSYSREYRLLGTGGAVANAIRCCSEKDIFVLNGDSLFKCDMHKLMENHLKQKSGLTMCVTEQDMGCDIVRLYENSSIVEYSRRALISTGVYVLNKRLKAFTEMGFTSFSFEHDFIRALIRKRKLIVNSYYENAYFIDVGTPENYYRSKMELD